MGRLQKNGVYDTHFRSLEWDGIDFQVEGFMSFQASGLSGCVQGVGCLCDLLGLLGFALDR